MSSATRLDSDFAPAMGAVDLSQRYRWTAKADKQVLCPKHSKAPILISKSATEISSTSQGTPSRAVGWKGLDTSIRGQSGQSLRPLFEARVSSLDSQWRTFEQHWPPRSTTTPGHPGSVAQRPDMLVSPGIQSSLGEAHDANS